MPPHSTERLAHLPDLAAPSVAESRTVIERLPLGVEPVSGTHPVRPGDGAPLPSLKCGQAAVFYRTQTWFIPK
jgi:hypothetical protein